MESSFSKILTDDFIGIWDPKVDVDEILSDPNIMSDLSEMNYSDDSSTVSCHSPQPELSPRQTDSNWVYDQMIPDDGDVNLTDCFYLNNDIKNMPIDLPGMNSSEIKNGYANSFEYRQQLQLPQNFQNYKDYIDIDDLILPRGSDIDDITQLFYNFTTPKPFQPAPVSENKVNIRSMVIGGSLEKEKVSVSNMTSQSVEKKVVEKKRSYPVNNKKVACQQRQNKYKHRKTRDQPNKCYHLWDFLKELLDGQVYQDHVCLEWTDKANSEFRIINTKMLATLWGLKKSSKNMTYDKLSRTIRYYCTLDILKKIDGKRLQFKFSNGKMWSKGGS